ncbi:terpene synthase family protein [Streptomyces sp. ALB3]|uniref:terpene synthase family protein n=1 Tax=Streptomyces sp. ALB3 TaxID=3374278 RepID=UPI0037B06CBD
MSTSAAASDRRLNSTVLDWAERLGVVTGTAEQERLAAMRLGEFAARAVPQAGAPAAELTAQWAAFVCLVDDRLDRGGLGSRPEAVRALFDQLLAVLNTDRAAVPRGAITSALADLWRRTVPGTTPRWRERFITDYRDFARATYEEAGTRRDGVRLPLGDYVRLRRLTITVLPMADIVERTADAPWPDRSGRDAGVRALRQAAADVAGWTNDLVSADSDVQAGQESLVAVVGREKGCSPSDARDRVTTMRDGRLRDFHGLAAALAVGEGVPGAAREPLRGYVAGLGSFLDATLHWLGVTGRFETRWLPTATAARPPLCADPSIPFVCRVHEEKH